MVIKRSVSRPHENPRTMEPGNIELGGLVVLRVWSLVPRFGAAWRLSRPSRHPQRRGVAGALGLCRLHEVAVREDAHQLATAGDGQATYLLLVHDPPGFFDVGVGLYGAHVLRHAVLRFDAAQVVSFGDAPDHDVAVCDHAHKLVAVGDGYEARVLLLHQLSDPLE